MPVGTDKVKRISKPAVPSHLLKENPDFLVQPGHEYGVQLGFEFY